MAIEFGAVCPEEPDPRIVTRVVGLALRVALGREAPVLLEEGEGVWTVRLGGAASALAYPAAPGEHEFADSWFVAVNPGTREALDWIVAIATAATTAEVYGGRFVDEAGLLRPDLPRGADLLTALIEHGDVTAEELVALVRRQQAGPPPG